MATGTQQPRVVPSYNPNERIVLMHWSSAQYGDTTYYADKLPCEIKWYKILSVLAAIFTTPVALLCLIPTVNYMEKVCTPKLSMYMYLDLVTRSDSNYSNHLIIRTPLFLELYSMKFEQQKCNFVQIIRVTMVLIRSLISPLRPGIELRVEILVERERSI